MSHKISSCGFLALECFHAEDRIQNGVGWSGVFLFLENNSHVPQLSIGYFVLKSFELCCFAGPILMVFFYLK